MAIDDEVFQTLLEQVRELNRRTDEITSSKTRVHYNIRRGGHDSSDSRLSWFVPPSLPSAQRELADKVVEARHTTALDDAVEAALARVLRQVERSRRRPPASC